MNITLKVNEETLNKMKDFYKENMVPNSGEYISFFAKVDGKTITGYNIKKGFAKVVFSSIDEARIWDNNVTEEVTPKKSTAPKEACWIYFDEQIGSDEVGVGDFFGPLCVCAAYVTKKDIEYLKSIGVDDSKRLTDERILEIGQLLINKIEYSLNVVSNEKYNDVNEKGLNMNEIKAKLHNNVLLKLTKKHKNARVFLDQFVEENTYYKYLMFDKEVVRDITFRTKGESYFPCVAVGSIIARYAFLKEMKALNEKYGVEIPFGASTKVNDFAKQFVQKFGINELEKVVKKNFKNYKEITE